MKKKNSFLIIIILLFFIFRHSKAQDLSNLDSIKPITISGSLSTTGGLYFVDGIEPRQPNPLFNVSGNFTVTVYNLSLPFSFILGNQEKGYNQPFNRFGVSPKYKWITLHLGHRNITYSPYTLAGHSFLGAGIELNPGLFRFGAVIGKFKREVQSDTTNLSSVPSFKRNGYGFKIGIGNQTNYVDLIMFKAKDDTLSVDSFAVEDNVLPAENLVVGISSKINTKTKFFVELDYAVSLYTRDIRAQDIETSDVSVSKPIISLFSLKASTQALKAGQAAVGYKGDNFGLSIRYKRIDPDYQTMGAYYFQSDVENITIEPYVKLFKRKLSIKSSLGFQHNNLNNTKAARTDRTIGSLTLVCRPVQSLSLNFRYSNYGITQRDGYQTIEDTVRMAQNNKSVSGGANYMIMKQNNTHSFNINSSYQALTDLNEQTAAYTENKNYNLQFTYSYGYIPAGFTLFLSFIRTKSITLLDQTRIYSGPGLGIGKQWFENKLNTSINFNIMSNKLNGNNEGNITNLSSIINYNLKKKHKVKLIYNFINNYSTNDVVDSYKETTLKLSYIYNF